MTISDNIDAIRQEIDQRLKDAKRDSGSAKLVAVSKTKPVEAVEEAIIAGQRIFGENRVQEAQGKFPNLKSQHPDLELHLIGPLQSNKAKDAVALFDVIQTLDRPKLVTALASAMKATGRRPKCLIQVNTGAEPQKAGVLPQDLPSLLAQAREVGLPVYGLMCIPPVEQLAPPHFAFLHKLAHDNNVVGEGEDAPWLSMGMSSDYGDAAALGATHVRVGSAIFGWR